MAMTRKRPETRRSDLCAAANIKNGVFKRMMRIGRIRRIAGTGEKVFPPRPQSFLGQHRRALAPWERFRCIRSIRLIRLGPPFLKLVRP
jgi:hypothetical protein